MRRIRKTEYLSPRGNTKLRPRNLPFLLGIHFVCSCVRSSNIVDRAAFVATFVMTARMSWVRDAIEDAAVKDYEELYASEAYKGATSDLDVSPAGTTNFTTHAWKALLHLVTHPRFPDLLGHLPERRHIPSQRSSRSSRAEAGAAKPPHLRHHSVGTHCLSPKSRLPKPSSRPRRSDLPPQTLPDPTSPSATSPSTWAPAPRTQN